MDKEPKVALAFENDMIDEAVCQVNADNCNNGNGFEWKRFLPAPGRPRAGRKDCGSFNQLGSRTCSILIFKIFLIELGLKICTQKLMLLF